MPRILWTSRAQADLLEIWTYIAADSPMAADKVLDDIDAAAQLVGRNPAAGRLRKELGPRLRSLPVGNYIVFYRAAEDGITVIRVLHGARDLPDLL